MTDGEATGTNGGTGGTKRRDEPLFLAICAGGVALFTGLNSLNVSEDLRRAGRVVAGWEPLVWEATSGVVLIALLPAVVFVARKAWPLAHRWPTKLAIHLAAAVGISLVHMAAMGALRWATYAGQGLSYDAFSPLRNWGYELRKDVLVYAGIVAAYVIWTRLRTGAAQATHAGARQALRLEVRDGARRRFIDPADVAFVEAAGNYVELHTPTGPLLHRASLAQMEQTLGAHGFVRIHRSRLVNCAHVAEVVSRPAGDFTVRLGDGRALSGSRRHRSPLLAPPAA